MPTAPGGARWVGVALWKGAPTVPWGAGWEAEKGTFQVRSFLQAQHFAELLELPLLLVIGLDTTRLLTVPGCRRSLVSRAAPPSAPPPCPRTPVSSATQRPLGGSLRELPGSSTSFSASSLGRLQTLLILTTMSEKDSRPSTTSGGRHCMHGDGPGMPVGVADEELFYSPTTGPAAGGANGSPASGGTPHSYICMEGPISKRAFSRAGRRP